jgi:hypothetical protein
MSILSLPCNFCYYFGYQQLNEGTAFGNFSLNSKTKLLNFKSFKFEDINPLLQITELDKKDVITQGNAKTLIRILKNLKSDAFNSVTLTGHQLTGIIYSMDDYTLSKPPGQLLFLLLEVSLYLKRLIENPFIRRSLKNADRTLLIEDSHEESFIHGIKELKKELDSLIKQLVLEIDLYSNIYDYVSITP